MHRKRRVITARRQNVDRESAPRNNVATNFNLESNSVLVAQLSGITNNKIVAAIMNPTFETIGLEVSTEKAFNYLAERAGDQGEPTQLSRRGAVLRGLLETRRRTGSLDCVGRAVAMCSMLIVVLVLEHLHSDDHTVGPD